jgi:hypothetical protein
MGTIAPKGSGTVKATLAGATDGKSDSLTPGIELEFNVRIRFADQRDTIVAIPVVRRILPPLTERAQPTPEMFINVVKFRQAISDVPSPARLRNETPVD